MKVVLAMTGLVLLAACAGPYDQALDSRTAIRPQPPVTQADARAREPYDKSAYFKKN